MKYEKEGGRKQRYEGRGTDYGVNDCREIKLMNLVTLCRRKRHEDRQSRRGDGGVRAEEGDEEEDKSEDC